LVFVFEYRALAFADFTLGEKILNSIFQSVTSRTAGFFSVNMTSLTTAVIVVAISWVVVATLILTITESAPFLWLLFEVVSAFATVGLSFGVTPELSDIGKFVITTTMYIGRVGPLTLFSALMLRSSVPRYRYAEEQVLIG